MIANEIRDLPAGSRERFDAISGLLEEYGRTPWYRWRRRRRLLAAYRREHAVVWFELTGQFS